ncbi:MAG: class I mannose-6-phosphate isomerase [Bacteroidaceae bacterium]|nr:class I mannose-6-phosphate isomerase [Bacteroidaceae bacterium]MBR0543932.1 class I mannose-6-phosphate isomerase [Bacteroidaceae bacterium]
MEILKFSPIFKPTLWGSETWVVSSVKGSESMAINGIDKGQTLPEIVARYGAEFLGKKNCEKFGNDFPLLIKFIDARQDLSIQVHPDDELSAQRHGKMGKNEMWYVVDADRGSQLIAGFTQKIETSEYAQKVADGSIENDLNKVCVSEGDCFYIPAGRVHGIGAGMVIAEIQQTSDVTYRIYDYLRRDRDGNLRELHTELALDAIDFEDITTDPKVNYTEKRDDIVSLVQCPFFTTNELKLTQSFKRDYTGIDSFRVYMCLSGQCCFLNPNGQSIFLHQGESLVVPAAIKEVTILPDENVKLLESYVE